MEGEVDKELDSSTEHWFSCWIEIRSEDDLEWWMDTHLQESGNLTEMPLPLRIKKAVSAHSKLTILFPLLIRCYTSGTVDNRDEVRV
jgi:hypothetical protein